MLRIKLSVPFLLILASCSAEPGAQVATRAAISAPERYQGATNERERLLAAIDILEMGKIRLGGHVSEVDKAFGTTFESESAVMSPDETTWGTLPFDPVVVKGPDSEASARRGWYLAVEFDGRGAVRDYVLTNAHK
jgi:hypothetical protein